MRVFFLFFLFLSNQYHLIFYLKNGDIINVYFKKMIFIIVKILNIFQIRDCSMLEFKIKNAII